MGNFSNVQYFIFLVKKIVISTKIKNMAFKFGIFLIGLAAAAIEKTPKFLNERKRAKIRKI